KRPWPSMIRTIWGDPMRFKKSYFPEELGGKMYLAGDGAIRDETTGYYTITGRIDDVLNVSGHRMGTMEIESALVANPIVAEAAVVDETGNDMPNGQGGILVVKRPWPSMIRTIWGDPERYRKSYYPEDFKGKYYLAGDGASTDEDGYYRIMGRIDDVLNVSGHRLGTMEIESALVANTKLVAEAAVVGRPDDLTGEAVVAFVVLKGARPAGEEAQRIAKELRDWVGKEIGAIAKPKDIRFGDNLPKTRSGKIMRRLLRSIAKGEAITQDVSTLENPAILEQLKQNL
ncbi:MAG TPA: hypothetical protein VFP36_07175, partial [Usitatibacter sp.]|nr:hypothetical protein [Usitatibacter sp.]